MNLSEKLSRERYDQEQAKAREQADKKAADEKNKADIKAGQDAIAAKKEQAASVGQSADLYEKKTAVAEQAVVSQSTIVHDPNARRFADQSEREAKRQATREAAREANLEKLSQKRGLRGKALDDYDALKNKRENAAFFKEKATQKRSEEAVLLDDIKTAIKNLSDKAEVLGTG